MITRRQFLRRGALWVPSLAIAKATLAQEQYLQNRRKAFRSQWTPLSVAGCVGWWKADAIVGLNDGDYVASWVDSSTAGNTATQSGADSLKPTYQTNELNALPVVRFDGGDFLNITAISGADPWTVFSIQKRTSSKMAGICSSAGNTYSTFQDGGSPTNCYISNRSEYGSASNVDSQNTWYSYTSQSISGVIYLRQNGISKTTSHVASVNTNNFNYIGRASAGYGTGDIAELLVYNTAVSAGDILLIEAYLKAKYAHYA